MNLSYISQEFCVNSGEVLNLLTVKNFTLWN